MWGFTPLRALLSLGWRLRRLLAPRPCLRHIEPRLDAVYRVRALAARHIDFCTHSVWVELLFALPARSIATQCGGAPSQAPKFPPTVYSFLGCRLSPHSRRGLVCGISNRVSTRYIECERLREHISRRAACGEAYRRCGELQVRSPYSTASNRGEGLGEPPSGREVASATHAFGAQMTEGSIAAQCVATSAVPTALHGLKPKRRFKFAFPPGGEGGGGSSADG